MSRISRRLAASLTLVVVIAVIVVIIEINHAPGSPAAADAAARSTATGAATVQRRNLVATDTESGTIAFAAPQTVYDRLSGTITWLPAVGRLIRPGQALFRVQDTPVILMNGTTPAYRDLGPSDTAGPDILQLNRDLVALGFDPEGIVVDDEWQTATTAAVDVYQASLGETETGTIPLGQVVFEPGAQLVASVTATAGSTGGGGGASSASLTGVGAHPEFVALTTSTPATTTTGSSHSATTPTAPSRPGTKRHGSAPRRKAPGRGGVQSTASRTDPVQRELQEALAALRAETAALQAARIAAGSHGSGAGKGSSGGSSGSGSGTGKSSSAGGGSAASSGSSGSSGSAASSGSSGTAPAVAVLSTTSDRLVVTVDLSASSQSEARVGGRVTVELPDNSTVPGRILSVSSVAQSSSNSGSANNGGGSGGGGGGNGANGGGGSSSATIPITIALLRHVSAHGLDQAAVSVQFTQARANHVLSVPVTALIATSGDTYAVQQAAAPHHLLPVTTGLFAAGYVQISGPGIEPGLQVTNSQG